MQQAQMQFHALSELEERVAALNNTVAQACRVRC